MNHKPKILILTASYGDGHLQAARALKQSFLNQGVECVRVVDLMREAHPFLNTITTTLYLTSTQTSKFGLDYYGWSYYMTRETKPDLAWNRYFKIIGKKKLKEIIAEERPDAIINTFPFGATPELCRGLGIPCFTVLTDFALHSRWIHPDIDKYYVAAEELKEQLVSIGCAPRQVEVSGIPIRSDFIRYDYSQPNEFAMQVDPWRKSVLILAGSYGVLGNVDEMIRELLAIDDCQVAVVCGRNRKLEQKLLAQYADQPDVHIFGFLENIHQLMSISSCIVSKAGGLTLSESLALRIPLFIYKPFAGQEKENALFLANKGVAAISNHTEELVSQIRSFFSDEKLAADIKARMTKLQPKCAAEFIAEDVLRTVNRTVGAHK
ncbi:Processive diacylglycerol beta-glucosyltransferase [Paenibacillus konkukensis]|uniref:Processive diacylglycerol beta-glucosyltransferase n=1 Tax=Paenibacillus konkukensis TaxID=2020716 RepID=A0ABY4RS05_9BACL|nr:glycosyltransferase [Paenibacillus konkukensis]UQZ84737.1 Processive diacylglycerol beta-glucosyltransferase [Paenibacillus konkukensis]